MSVTMSRRRAVAFIVIMLLCIASPRIEAGEKILQVKAFPLNTFSKYLDGQWQGMTVASDGNCYFSSSSHGKDHGCLFFRYSPKSGKVTVLANDITYVCGEDPKKTTPQGKIHSDIVEHKDWLYFGTHLSNYWPEAMAAYTGSHIIGFQLSTGKFRDYGVIRKNFTNYSGIALDAKRGLLYVYVTPFPKGDGVHIYRLNLETGAKKDLGLVHPGKSAAFYLFVDGKGDLWFTSRKTGSVLYQIRASDDKIIRHENALPPLHSWKTPGKKTPHPKRDFLWMKALPDGQRAVFKMTGPWPTSGGMLWRFDPRKDLKNAFTPIIHTGPTTLGMNMAGGRIFFIQRPGGKAVVSDGQVPDHNLHLLSAPVDPDGAGGVIDHGSIRDPKGRKPFRIESIAADAHGRVYMTGDWIMLPGEQTSMRYSSKTGKYRRLKRGQVFVVGDVSKDLQAVPGWTKTSE